MTNGNKNGNETLYLPIVLALLFVLIVAAVSWFTLPASRRGAVEQAEIDITVAEEVADAVPAESDAPEVDLEATIAAINKGGCIACHTIPGIPGAVGQVGPNLSNIGVDAADRREGYTAEEYIHESLVEPNAFIAPECPTGPCPLGAMPVIRLDEAEIQAIVSYLLTLKASEAEADEAETVEELAEAAAPVEMD